MGERVAVGVRELLGVGLPVEELVRVTEGVKVGDRVPVRVKDGVPVDEPLLLGVPEGVRVAERACAWRTACRLPSECCCASLSW